MRQFLAKIPALLTSATILAGLLLVVPADAQSEPRELVVGFQYDVDTLDPARLGPIETDVAYKVYSNLVRLQHGTTDEFVPDLATDWSVSDDGTVYTFHLRQGVQWHRGYGELTAQDVKFSFERLKDEALASPHLPEAMTIDEVVVVDDYTVEVRLTGPWPDFLTQFVAYRPGFIVNEQALLDAGENVNSNVVGTGAYTLETLSPRDEIVLQRFDDYYGEPPYFDTIRYAIVLEETVLQVALERGEIDIFYATDPLVARSLVDNPELKTERFVSNRVYFLYLNTARPPTDDKQVRQAIWWAIDKEEIAEVAMEGMAQPTDTLLNPKIAYYLDERPYNYDPDRARAMLEEAGFDFDTTLSMPMESTDTMVPVIQAQLARIGVTVETPLVERLQHVERMTSGDYHLGMRALLRDTADQYFSRFFPEANIPYPNASRYVNPEMETLINEARTEVDPERRRELYYRIQRIVHEDAPMIPIVNPEWVLAMRPDIEGAVPGNLRIPEDTIRRVD